MARSTLQSSGLSNFSTAGVTRYETIGSGDVANNVTTEANRQTPIRTAGTISNLYAHSPSNGHSSTSTVTLRKNTADGNNTVSIPATTTGDFLDLTSIDTIAAGDLVNYKIVIGGSGTGLWITSIKCVFNADVGTMTKFNNNNSGGMAKSAISTEYMGVDGVGSVQATEANVARDINIAGTWKNLSLYVSANTRTDTTTYANRINTANGTLAISVTTTATGLFEDTTHSDAVAANDDINYAITAAAGSGSITTQFISSELITVDGTFDSGAMRAAGNAQGFNETNYDHVSGDLTWFTSTWTDEYVLLPTRFTNQVAVISANTLNSGTSTIRLRKNNANVNASLSIGFGATGTFEDTSSVDDFIHATDKANIQVATSGTSGSMTMRAFSIKQEPFYVRNVIGGHTGVPTLS